MLRPSFVVLVRPPDFAVQGLRVSACGHRLFTDLRRKSKAATTGEQSGLEDPGSDSNEFRLRRGVGGLVLDNFGLHGKSGLLLNACTTQQIKSR